MGLVESMSSVHPKCLARLEGPGCTVDAIHFACELCGGELDAPAAAAGERMVCPHCDGLIVVAARPEAAPPSPAPPPLPPAEDADEIFVNGDSLIPGAHSLDPVFKSRMFSGV